MQRLAPLFGLIFALLATSANADQHAATDFVADEPIVVFAPTGDHSDQFITELEMHAIAVLQWQLRTSDRILTMVMLLTAAGVLFAGFQLWHTMRRQTQVRLKRADETDATPLAHDTTSKLSFGDGKFEVTSPIVGILILMISLGALYLFLSIVYSIDVMPLTGL
ncbi:hypothetical protein FHS72_000350 [Loktanella ponticola]|uniref:Uncharacterized protein n=1 Tax=Yoonia ponticola TaxID=1524255 RepID=A0A7W9EYB6_9RHOB|nr:hypothetical protein [Yoonia ponticola]MBB5720746.1 hypothetical protein [Yoonia ponticola]